MRKSWKDENWNVRHPYFRKWIQKLRHLKKRYGGVAKEYFLAHPYCERCGNRFLACLGIHHKEGKKKQFFETLCANCHAIHHSAPYTFEDVERERKIKYRIGRPMKLVNRPQPSFS